MAAPEQSNRGVVEALAREKCRRVTCECSDPSYCDGWKTCADRGLSGDELCPPCLVRAATLRVAVLPAIHAQRDREVRGRLEKLAKELEAGGAAERDADEPGIPSSVYYDAAGRVRAVVASPPQQDPEVPRNPLLHASFGKTHGDLADPQPAPGNSGGVEEAAMNLIEHLLYTECGHCGSPEPERLACGCDACKAIGIRTAALRDAIKAASTQPSSPPPEPQDRLYTAQQVRERVEAAIEAAVNAYLANEKALPEALDAGCDLSELPSSLAVAKTAALAALNTALPSSEEERK